MTTITTKSEYIKTQFTKEVDYTHYSIPPTIIIEPPYTKTQIEKCVLYRNACVYSSSWYKQ